MDVDVIWKTVITIPDSGVDEAKESLEGNMLLISYFQRQRLHTSMSPLTYYIVSASLFKGKWSYTEYIVLMVGTTLTCRYKRPRWTRAQRPCIFPIAVHRSFPLVCASSEGSKTLRSILGGFRSFLDSRSEAIGNGDCGKLQRICACLDYYSRRFKSF